MKSSGLLWLEFLPMGSDESVIITSKASWFCFMNSKPSPTCKVSLALEYPTAIPGRYFLDTWITSCNTESTAGSEEAYKQLLLRLLCSCDWKNSTMSHFFPYLQRKSDSPAKSTRAASILSQQATLSLFLQPQDSVTLLVCPCQTQQKPGASKASWGAKQIWLQVRLLCAPFPYRTSLA